LFVPERIWYRHLGISAPRTLKIKVTSWKMLGSSWALAALPTTTEMVEATTPSSPDVIMASSPHVAAGAVPCFRSDYLIAKESTGLWLVHKRKLNGKRQRNATMGLRTPQPWREPCMRHAVHCWLKYNYLPQVPTVWPIKLA